MSFVEQQKNIDCSSTLYSFLHGESANQQSALSIAYLLSIYSLLKFTLI